MQRWGYGDTIGNLLEETPEQVFGKITAQSSFADLLTQKDAWLAEIEILRSRLHTLASKDGAIYFEYTIPRLGGRVDVVLVLEHVLFVIEFKVGAKKFTQREIDQVWDYALDLKNFHESSYCVPIVPMLVATQAQSEPVLLQFQADEDQVARPVCIGADGIAEVIRLGLEFFSADRIDPEVWQSGRYRPTPTIVEAARALYAGHAVEEISRSDAGGENLAVTSRRLSEIIAATRSQGAKAICFVTGVPGAAKTLVGLDIATRHVDENDEFYSVFLSGNGPLVNVLREALARDHYQRAKGADKRIRLGEARSEVKQFIQNVHNFRDDCIADSGPPIEHVALFDEAQRAWNLSQTANFMARRKNLPGFEQSEPEFLISCLDRHSDWAVIVCLVGSGQEINTGEAGIAEWLASLERRPSDWQVYLSPRLREIEFHVDDELDQLENRHVTHSEPSLHLATSVRSFRSERVSEFVNCLLALDDASAREALTSVLPAFPILLTRTLSEAKIWLRAQARGSERYGMMVSSRAQRLKPLAIDVRVNVDPVRWFLDGKEDVRSSFYLEDVATEFQVQGLELDWSCVVWDGDLRYRQGRWEHFDFKGSRWEHIRKDERRRYLENTYRVLLTRARQGMVIVVPDGNENDLTRAPAYYDPTYEWLTRVGVSSL